MKAGDLVLKSGDLDCGQIGIILKVYPPNSIGHSFIDVLTLGVIKKWYVNLVEVISGSQ